MGLSGQKESDVRRIPAATSGEILIPQTRSMNLQLRTQRHLAVRSAEYIVTTKYLNGCPPIPSYLDRRPGSVRAYFEFSRVQRGCRYETFLQLLLQEVWVTRSSEAAYRQRRLAPCSEVLWEEIRERGCIRIACACQTLDLRCHFFATVLAEALCIPVLSFLCTYAIKLNHVYSLLMKYEPKACTQ